MYYVKIYTYRWAFQKPSHFSSIKQWKHFIGNRNFFHELLAHIIEKINISLVKQADKGIWYTKWLPYFNKHTRKDCKRSLHFRHRLYHFPCSCRRTAGKERPCRHMELLLCTCPPRVFISFCTKPWTRGHVHTRQAFDHWGMDSVTF